LPADIATLDGHVRTPGSVDSIWLIYDRLIAYDEKLVPGPMLAESWDVAADYKQITFNLRRGVQFHSGREFTSDDVKYNLLRVRDPKVANTQFINQSNWFTGIETPDKYTVLLTSDQPRPSLFDFFENFNMLDHETMDGPDFKTKAVGTGPFVFGEWVQGDHFTFTKNPNYWQTGKPYLDGLRINIRDAQSAMTQLQAGALDAVKAPGPLDVNALKSDAKYAYVAHPNPGTILEMGINLTLAPFSDKRVRQALNFALNRQRLVDQIYLGTSEVRVLPWSASSPAYDASKNTGYTFDLAKAADLLKQANVSNLQMENYIMAGAYPLIETFLVAYQADLASLGITMSIKSVAAPAWLDAVNNHRYAGMYTAGDNGANVWPATMLNVSSGWNPGVPNNSGLVDDNWKQLVAAASTEVDPARQKQIFAEVNDYILDQCFCMPMMVNPAAYETRSALRNMTPNMHAGGFLYTDAWLEN
jgi:peptide/nickel transport system substrate-binding protein